MSKKLPKKLQTNLNAIDRMNLKSERDLARAYRESLKEIRGILAEAYAKHDMQMHEMQKYNRLIGLEKEIKDQLNEVTRKGRSIIKQSISNSYEETFYRTGFVLESELQVKLAFNSVDPDILRRVINNDMSGLPWVERITKNKEDLIYQVKQEITQGLVHGESYPQMAKRISERMNVSERRALDLARTEAGRARSEATFDGIKHAEARGIKARKRWVSTLDDSTRSSHQDLDGEVVDVDQPFSNGLMYPGDPSGDVGEVINCRCEVVTEFEGLEDTSRRARDEGLIPYTTYNDWKKNRVH